MTNAAEWTFDVYMEMRFSGKKTWFVKAVNNETGVYWVNRESFDHAPDDARELVRRSGLLPMERRPPADGG